MKEMVYQKTPIREVLDCGTIDGYAYAILSLGTHPTAYVNVPAGHPAYKKDYNKIDMDVHGGLTYGSSILRTSKTDSLDGWWLGWDYAHYTDYSGCFPSEWDQKRWTTEEIMEDVKTAVAQLKEMEANNA